MEVFEKKFIFIDYKSSFPLREAYAKKHKKLKEELENIVDPQASVLLRLFLTSQTVPFKPNESTLLAFLRSSVALVRQNALYCFDTYYGEELVRLTNHNFWLSGKVDNYKLASIREILKQEQSKVVTRFSKNVDVLVVGEGTKLETLPEGLFICSTLIFTLLLEASNKDDYKKEILLKSEIDEAEESLLVEALLNANNEKLLEHLEKIEKGMVVGDTLSLLLAIYKVHPLKNIRIKAKELLERESSKPSKEALDFCEARNFLNAKYTVGMEELEKIKGFQIDLFLYYLVKVQKNHLGKEYLARLDSHWTERFLEESSLLNQKKLELFSTAGKRFMVAKNIEHFSVHANSDVLWQMSWLKSLKIRETKEALILPQENSLNALESLILESKEIVLAGHFGLKSLSITKCKALKIEESFSIPKVEELSFAGSSFSMDELKRFFERADLPLLKSISFKGFANYKIPKDWDAFLAKRFVGIIISY